MRYLPKIYFFLFPGTTSCTTLDLLSKYISTYPFARVNNLPQPTPCFYYFLQFRMS